MEYKSRSYVLKNGKDCIVRSAEPEDAPVITRYRIETADETPFLSRSGAEIVIPPESEIACLKEYKESDKAVMLIAEIDGELAGCCWIDPVSNRVRHRHRCELAIALYRKYCGYGLGNILISEIAELAKMMNYEQMELEVSSHNRNAVSLYIKAGFRVQGCIHNSMKFPDGTYEDAYSMIRELC